MVTGKVFAKYFTTAALFFLNFSKGLMFAVPGPTLLSLADITKTTLGQISWIFFCRGSGVVIGSVSSGFASQSCRTVVLGVSIIVVSVSIGCVPWLTNQISLFINFIVNGLSYGCISATMNYFTLQLWEDNSPPVFSASICCFLIGATLAPILAVPFLSRSNHAGPDIYGQSSGVYNFSNLLQSNVSKASPNLFDDVTKNMNSSELDRMQHSQIVYEKDDIRELYFVLMCCGLLSAVLVIAGSVMTSRAGLAELEVCDVESSDQTVIDEGRQRMMFIVLCFIYQVCLLGLEYLFVSFIAAYMVKGLGQSPQVGTLICAMFWGIYTAVALVGIALAHYLTPSTILLFNSILLPISGIVLFCGQGNSTMTWVGTGILAFGYGPTYANIFLWANYYVRLTRKITGLFVAAPELGGVIMPVVVGQFFSDNPRSLMTTTLASSFICATLFVLAECVALPFHRGKMSSAFGRRHTKAYYTALETSSSDSTCAK